MTKTIGGDATFSVALCFLVDQNLHGSSSLKYFAQRDFSDLPLDCI
jgi:hypothetical protein